MRPTSNLGEHTPTVVTILSTNYAGSHFLSYLLGSHSRGVHIDEVRHFSRSSTGLRSDCRICGPIEQCLVVRNVAAAGMGAVYRQIHSNFTAAGQNPLLLVDTSKKVDWAEQFIGDPAFRYKYIHLIRDPRALVRRWLLTHHTLKAALHLRRKAVFRGNQLRPGMLLAPRWKVCVYKWLHANQEIDDFIVRHQLDCRIVTYSDMATDSAAELPRIMDWIGLPFEQRQLEYWKVEHHVPAATRGYAWTQERSKSAHIDLRWREFLSPAVREAITQNADLNAYLARKSLNFTDRGLSRDVGGQIRRAA